MNKINPRTINPMTTPRPQTCFVLLPGFAPDSVPVLELKRALEKRGYAVVASNFFGDIAVDNFSDLTRRQCTDAIYDLIQEAKSKYQKVVGVGISLGGALLLEHAKKHNNLDCIVSIGTPFKFKSRLLVKIGQALIQPIYPAWRHFQKYKRLRLLPIGAANMAIEYIEKEFGQNLELITVPALLIHSKKDWISDYCVMPEFISKLSSAPKELIILNNGSHTVNSGADLIIQHAETFLKKIK